MPRRLALVIFVIALVVAAHAAAWFYYAEGLSTGIAGWVEARRAEGLTVRHGEISVGGYPFAFDADIDRPAIAAPGPNGWSWAAERLALNVPVSLSPPDKIGFSAPGRHTIRAAGAAQTPLIVEAAAATGSLALTPQGRIREVSLDADGLKVMPDRGAPVTARRLEADIMLLPAGPRAASELQEPTRARLVAKAQEIDLPEKAVEELRGLGRRIDAAEIDVTLHGTLSAGPLHDALEKWRKAGGTIEIARFNARWNQAQMSASGTLALDDALQPVAALDTTMTGVPTAIDALVDSGAVKPRVGAAAKIVLRILAGNGATGRPADGPVKVPVTVQGRHLSVGPARLMRLPTIDWP